MVLNEITNELNQINEKILSTKIHMTLQYSHLDNHLDTHLDTPVDTRLNSHLHTNLDIHWNTHLTRANECPNECPNACPHKSPNNYPNECENECPSKKSWYNVNVSVVIFVKNDFLENTLLSIQILLRIFIWKMIETCEFKYQKITFLKMNFIIPMNSLKMVATCEWRGGSEVKKSL